MAGRLLVYYYYSSSFQFRFIAGFGSGIGGLLFHNSFLFNKIMKKNLNGIEKRNGTYKIWKFKFVSSVYSYGNPTYCNTIFMLKFYFSNVLF